MKKPGGSVSEEVEVDMNSDGNGLLRINILKIRVKIILNCTRARCDYMVVT